jgi:hypothetical protein
MASRKCQGALTAAVESAQQGLALLWRVAEPVFCQVYGHFDYFYG